MSIWNWLENWQISVTILFSNSVVSFQPIWIKRNIQNKFQKLKHLSNNMEPHGMLHFSFRDKCTIIKLFTTTMVSSKNSKQFSTKFQNFDEFFSKNIRRQNHRCGTKEGTIHWFRRSDFTSNCNHCWIDASRDLVIHLQFTCQLSATLCPLYLTMVHLKIVFSVPWSHVILNRFYFCE